MNTCHDCIMLQQAHPRSGYCTIRKLSYSPSHTCHLWCGSETPYQFSPCPQKEILATGWEHAVEVYAQMLFELADKAKWDENKMIWVLNAHKIAQQKLKSERERE